MIGDVHIHDAIGIREPQSVDDESREEHGVSKDLA